MGVGRRAAAEKAKAGLGGYLVPRAGGDEDRVAGADFPGFSVDIHDPGTLKNEVEFFGQSMVVALGGAISGNGVLQAAQLLQRLQPY